jgi:hypothetical protein
MGNASVLDRFQQAKEIFREDGKQKKKAKGFSLFSKETSGFLLISLLHHSTS